MKKRNLRPRDIDYVRVTLSIPKDLWKYFEAQRKLPRHGGSRSSYVRSLIVEEMEALGMGAK